MLRDKTSDWTQFVEEIQDNYNETRHMAIKKITPNDAFEKDNEEKIRNLNLEKRAINNVLKRTQTDLKVGDKVRKHVLGLVETGAAVRWSDEVFKVRSIQGQTITLDDQSRQTK